MRKKTVKNIKSGRIFREKLNTISQGEGLTIAIDIDGTIADSARVDFANAHKLPEELMKAKPITKARCIIQKLYRAGHKIVFHSSRLECQRQTTEKWLKKHNFPHHHLELRKFAAHIYIDDRAINGRDWKCIVRELKEPNLPGYIARKKGMA